MRPQISQILEKMVKSPLCKKHPSIKSACKDALNGDNNEIRALHKRLEENQADEAKRFIQELNGANSLYSDNKSDHPENPLVRYEQGDMFSDIGTHENIGDLSSVDENAIEEVVSEEQCGNMVISETPPEESASAQFMVDEFGGEGYQMIGPGEVIKTHPSAEIFPMLSDCELDELAENIKSIGLRVPVLVCDGQLIDGRNRLEACRRAGVDAQAEELPPETDVTNMIISLNLMRRQLSSSQRAALAVELLPALREKAEIRKKSGVKSPEKGEATVEAAKRCGTNAKYVSQAAVIKANDEKLFRQVVSGEIKLSAAAKASAADSINDLDQPKKIATTWSIIVEKILALCPPESLNHIIELAQDSNGAAGKLLRQWCDSQQSKEL
jgi:ParB/Sulfiredoxin domain